MSTTGHYFEDADGAPYPEEVQVLARQMSEDLYFGANAPNGGQARADVTELLVAVDRAVRKQIEEEREPKPPPGTVTFAWSDSPSHAQRRAHAAAFPSGEFDAEDLMRLWRRVRDDLGEDQAIDAFLTIGYKVTVSR